MELIAFSIAACVGSSVEKLAISNKSADNRSAQLTFLSGARATIPLAYSLPKGANMYENNGSYFDGGLLVYLLQL